MIHSGQRVGVQPTHDSVRYSQDEGISGGIVICRVAIKMSSNNKFNLHCISFILSTEKLNGIELNQVEQN